MEGDLELKGEDDGASGAGSQSVRKNIALHLKPQVNKNKSKKSSSKQKHPESLKDIKQSDLSDKEEFQLPSMKGPSEPLHQNKRLRWSHKVNIVGEKIVDPVIHCCEICALPILLYGRVIPCKHIFCYDCAKKADKNCPRCHDAIQRVEQSALGTVFVCTIGGTKLGVSGCRRTYLSQRDLQAHIAYRHAQEIRQLPSQQTQVFSSSQAPPLNMPPPGMMAVFPPHVRPDDVLLQHHQQQRANTPPDSHEFHSSGGGGGGGQAIPVMVRNVNLITVPIHHEEDYQRHQQPSQFIQPITQAATNSPYQIMGGVGQLTMQSPPFPLSNQPPPGPFSGPPPPVNPHFVVPGPPPMTLTVALPPGHRPPQQGPPPTAIAAPSNFPNPMGNPSAPGWPQPGTAIRGPLLSTPRTGGPMAATTSMPQRPFYQ